MNKVVLVTVTYNSSAYLEKLIEAVAQQSVCLEKIVVVDNASNEQNIKRLEELQDKYRIIDLQRLDKNLGGAGGFEYGVRYAVNNIPDCDWIWMMDDDAYPEFDTLEVLLGNQDLSDIGLLCPLIIGIESGKPQVYHHKKLSRYLNRDELVFENEDELDEITEIQANSFVGPLIPINVIKDVGFPDSSFFIEGDDTEYTYRITRKYKAYLVKKARVHHRDIVENIEAISPFTIWKEYYHYRNRFLIIDRYLQDKIDCHKGKLLLVKNAFGMIYTVMKYNKFKYVRKDLISLICRGINDGLRGIQGKTIDPGEFNKKFKT